MRMYTKLQEGYMQSQVPMVTVSESVLSDFGPDLDSL
jgi:hypothetical protein